MTKRLSWFEENLRTTSNALRAEWREDSTNECFNAFLIKRLIKFKAQNARIFKEFEDAILRLDKQHSKETQSAVVSTPNVMFIEGEIKGVGWALKKIKALLLVSEEGLK